jgi:hypothetical protein
MKIHSYACRPTVPLVIQKDPESRLGIFMPAFLRLPDQEAIWKRTLPSKWSLGDLRQLPNNRKDQPTFKNLNPLRFSNYQKTSSCLLGKRSGQPPFL